MSSRPWRKAATRAYAIRWLRAKNPPTRDYRGLDTRRVHFACGCSITKPYHREATAVQPGYGRTKVCAEHVRALGTGAEL